MLLKSMWSWMRILRLKNTSIIVLGPSRCFPFHFSPFWWNSSFLLSFFWFSLIIWLFLAISFFQVSPNNKLVAYAEDTKGDEIYTVYVIDAETRTPVGKPLQNVTSYLEWAGDSSLMYITMDEILRPDKVGSCWYPMFGNYASLHVCTV